MPDTDRQTQGFQLGTVLGTILFTPVNFNALIYGFRYAAPSTAAGTITAELRTSKAGTITGTVDVVSLQPGQSVRDAIGERPIAKVPAGQYLVGLVTTVGSIEGVVVYAYQPGRLE